MKTIGESGKISDVNTERIKRLRLFDDKFMSVCFDGYNEGAELLLRIILRRNDFKIKSVVTQKSYKNLQGRDVILDIVAQDESGTVYNIEVQRDGQRAGGERARYHLGILDSSNLKPNEDFNKLPKTYVIFITEKDVIGGRLPIYTVIKVVEELGDGFEDRSRLIYVNGTDQNPETDLGKLMHDFHCTEADDMYFKVLADRVRQFKENGKGVNDMLSVFDEIYDEGMSVGRDAGRAEGIAEGTVNANVNAIRVMITTFHVTVEEAFNSLQVPEAERPRYIELLKTA